MVAPFSHRTSINVHDFSGIVFRIVVSQILNGKWFPKGSHFSLMRRRFWRYFRDIFATLSFMLISWRLLLTVGSIFVSFDSLWAAFGSLLANFWYPLARFWCSFALLVPPVLDFSLLVHPGVILHLFLYFWKIRRPSVWDVTLTLCFPIRVPSPYPNIEFIFISLSIYPNFEPVF